MTEYLYVILPGVQGRGEAPEFAQHAAQHGAAIECADGGHVCLLEERANMSAAHKGKELPKERRKKIGDGLRRAYAEGRR